MITIHLTDRRFHSVKEFAGPNNHTVAVLSQFKHNPSLFRIDIVRWNPEVLHRFLASFGLRARRLDSCQLVDLHYRVQIQCDPDKTADLIQAVEQWAMEFAKSPRLKVKSITYLPSDRPVFVSKFRHVRLGQTLYALDYGHQAFPLRNR